MPIWSIIKDQRSWRGVANILPGEQVLLSVSTSGVLTTIYTVPANKTLYLTWYNYISHKSSTSYSSNGTIYNSVGTAQAYLYILPNGSFNNIIDSCALTTPIVLHSGWYISLNGGAGSDYQYLSLCGYLT